MTPIAGATVPPARDAATLLSALRAAVPITRKAHGHTQAQTAAIVGTYPAAISKFERGLSIPQSLVTVALMRYCGWTIQVWARP